jgi:multidrug efflux pump subunit AcrA (membrane-fusion protein)
MKMRHTLLLLVFVAGCGPKADSASSKPTEPSAVTVTTTSVQSRQVQRSVNVVGSLTGYDEVVLSPKVDGRVRKIHIDVGDRVYPGEVVLEMDPVDLQLEADAARRGLEAELARLGIQEIPTGEFRVQDVPSVSKMILLLANAKSEYDRLKKLAESGAVSSKETDNAVLDLRSAEINKRDAETQAIATLASARLRKSNLDAAEQRLKDANLTVPSPDLASAWGAVVGAGFNPVIYRVSARMITEGEMIRSNPVTNAFRLVIDNAVKLRSAVPEQFSSEVRIGQEVSVKVDAYPMRSFRGIVSRINPTVDRETRTFAVEILVPNLDGSLKPGSFARAAILTRTEAVKAVPPQAVLTFAGVHKVFVIQNDVAKAIEVKLGLKEKEWVEIQSELPADASLATSGFSQLVEGSRVTVRK